MSQERRLSILLRQIQCVPYIPKSYWKHIHHTVLVYNGPLYHIQANNHIAFLFLLLIYQRPRMKHAGSAALLYPLTTPLTPRHDSANWSPFVKRMGAMGKNRSRLAPSPRPIPAIHITLHYRGADVGPAGRD